MKRWMMAVVIGMCSPAFAQSSGLKPGLWEMKSIRQVVDGQDMSAQMAAANAKMQAAMANMTPAQRQQMEAMMGAQAMPGQTAQGTTRVCISAAMAARDKPMVDPEGRCEPAKVARSGNKSSFEFSCAGNGRTEVGKGESTISADTVTTHVDMTMTDARGRHTMQTDSEMRYLGSDCQGVKPRY